MQPNILVILCDQLRKDFLSCYGGTVCNTPNLDALAAKSVCFTNAITASPVCAPARASMMTGRYVSDHGVWTNDMPFREGVDYLPQRMNQAGYRTGAFGKLHHFPAKDGKGFSTYALMEENRLGDKDDYFQWLRARHPEIRGVFTCKKDGGFAFAEDEYYEHWIADRAIDFIAEDKDAPYFAWISFQGPHTPLDPPGDCDRQRKVPPARYPNYKSGCDVPDYRSASIYGECDELYARNYRQRYCQLIEAIDKQIGRVLEQAQNTARGRETMILFSADHGDMCGDLGHYQKGPMPYSAQLEIPLLLYGCGGENTICDCPVSNLDIGATILQAAGDDAPFGVSRSLNDAIKGGETARKSVFSEFCDSVKIVDTGRWRLAYYPFTGQSQLFDKTLPNYEVRNLAVDSEYALIRCELLQQIIDYMITAHEVHIEAQDLVPSVQAGLRNKLPNFMNQIPLAFPLQTQAHRLRLRTAGLDADYNEFCKGRDIQRHYGVYWNEDGQEKHNEDEA